MLSTISTAFSYVRIPGVLMAHTAFQCPHGTWCPLAPTAFQNPLGIYSIPVSSWHLQHSSVVMAHTVSLWHLMSTCHIQHSSVLLAHTSLVTQRVVHSHGCSQPSRHFVHERHATPNSDVHTHWLSVRIHGRAWSSCDFNPLQLRVRHSCSFISIL